MTTKTKPNLVKKNSLFSDFSEPKVVLPQNEAKIKPRTVDLYHFVSRSSLDYLFDRQVFGDWLYGRYKQFAELSAKESLTFEYDNEEVFSRWCDYIASIHFDFDSASGCSVGDLEVPENVASRNLELLISDFIRAVDDYKELQQEFHDLAVISIESARRLLSLAPVISMHNPRVHIDSTSGCFNFDIHAEDEAVLTVHVSSNGHVQYSYVSQGRWIYKITGSAKFKDVKDSLYFKKVLRMV